MSYHPDTDDYLTRLASAGGTISQFNTDLLDTKIRFIYANNLRGGATDFLKYWLWLNLAESFTGSLVPVYDDGVGNATNFNFGAGDWSSTLGLTGNGTDKYLNTNFNLSSQLGTFSLAGRYDYHLSFEQTSTATGAFCNFMGLRTGASGNLTNFNISGFPDISQYYFRSGRGTANIVNTSSAVFPAILMGSTTSSTTRLLRNNALINSASGVPATQSDPTFPLFLFARNAVGGGAESFSSVSASSFTIGYGLSPEQETALYNILALDTVYYASPLMLTAC